MYFSCISMTCLKFSINFDFNIKWIAVGCTQKIEINAIHKKISGKTATWNALRYMILFFVDTMGCNKQPPTTCYLHWPVCSNLTPSQSSKLVFHLKFYPHDKIIGYQTNPLSVFHRYTLKLLFRNKLIYLNTQMR